MKKIKDGSIDMILCDLPYGTTVCKWDTVIPFEPLWEEYNRVIKQNGAIVLFGCQPFTTQLINSNIPQYRYNWVWEKSQGVNFAQCNHMPLKITEDICVFGNFGMSKNAKVQPVYNPQGIYEINKTKAPKTNTEHRPTDNNKEHIQKFANYPTTILRFSNDRGLHPTQKPVALFEYLIKTYTNKGETVLDNCMGSGTTAIACINTNRNYIGFETDKRYFDVAEKRIKEYKTK